MKIKDQKRISIIKLLGPGIFVTVLLLLGNTWNVYAKSIEQLLPESMKGAELVGTEACAACHDKQMKEFNLSAHARIATTEETEGVAQSCEICHGPGSVHVDNGGGRGTMINPNKKPEICFTCHMDKKMEFRLPFHPPVLEGHMSCSDCHNLHGVDARPWTSTSMEDINGTCFNCHKDKQGPFPWEHEAVRDGCTTCHKVHGSINDKMLLDRGANLCLRCHIQTNFPEIGIDHGHASNLNRGTCWSGGCHTEFHGSYYDRHFRE